MESNLSISNRWPYDFSIFTTDCIIKIPQGLFKLRYYQISKRKKDAFDLSYINMCKQLKIAINWIQELKHTIYLLRLPYVFV